MIVHKTGAVRGDVDTLEAIVERMEDCARRVATEGAEACDQSSSLSAINRARSCRGSDQ